MTTSPTPRRLPLLLATALAAMAAAPAHAANFNLNTNSTTAQTLGSGSGQTGTVAAGKALTVGGSTVAVTVSGNNATLTNLGTISQTGTGRVVRDNTGVTNLTINNGSNGNATALMQAADADVIQMNKSPASVTLNNYGSMVSLNASAGGSQAVDFAAIASGANVVNNYAGALLKASEADAVRPGVNGVVNNAGTIQSVTSTGGGSDGIDGQNNSGIQINNAVTGIISGGRHGITGGQLDSVSSYTMQVTNQAGGIISGNNGAGINLDGFNHLQTATITNHGQIIGNGVTGDGDGVDVDGLVNIVNTGIIRSSNAYNPPASGVAYSEGISVGGGVIVNSGLIEGLVGAGNANAVGRGITLIGNDITSGPQAGLREGLYGNAQVTNQAGGVIRGQGGSAIVSEGAAAASGFTIVLNNQAGGQIVGGSGMAAAIVTSKDGTTINNAGLIDGASSGKAIQLGSGNNTVNITGGAAAVLGDIDGGMGGVNRLNVTPGAAGSFSYSGILSNFGTVEFGAGNVTLSGASTYAGATRINNGTLSLDGANRLSAASALALDSGTLNLLNAGALGQAFASLSLKNSSAIDLNGTVLTLGALGEIGAGSALALTDANDGYALRLLGDLTRDAALLELLKVTTLDGGAVSAFFDGQYTEVRAAVPEPGSVLLLLAGLAGIVAARRRQSGGGH